MFTCTTLLATLASVTSATELSLTVHDGASFEIALNGKPWLAGGDVQVGGLSSAAGTLVQAGAPTTSASADALGAYNATTFTWAKADDGAPLMRTSFRTYSADPAVIVFEQSFPSALNLTALGAQRPLKIVGEAGRGSGASYVATDPSGSASTLFPAFARGDGRASDGFACFAYHGVFPQMKACTLKDYAETHQGGSPLVVYEPDAPGASAASLRASVFSQLTSAKALHLSSSALAVGVGVKATAAGVAAGWSALSILSAGDGVSAAMMAWGDKMLAFSGKAVIAC